MHDKLAPERPLPPEQEGPFVVDVRLTFEPDHLTLVHAQTVRNTLPGPRRDTALWNFQHTDESCHGSTDLLQELVRSGPDTSEHPPEYSDPAYVHDLLATVAYPATPEQRDLAWDALVTLVNGPHPHQY